MKWFHKIANNLTKNNKRPSLVNWLHGNKSDKELAQKEKETEQGEKHDEENESDDEDDTDPYSVNTVNLTRQEVKALKNGMQLIPTLVTPSAQLEWYAKMKVSTKKANTNGYCAAALMAVGFIVPLFVKQLGTFPTRLLASVAVGTLMWYLAYLQAKSHYSQYSFENELRFNKVITVLDLSELKRGFSINAILAGTAERFRRDQVLSDSISTLSSRIGDDPTSPRPYLEFSHEFSTTQRARLFMMAVYRMAQGHYDDTQIKSIKHAAAADVTFQSKRLAQKKIARYRKLNLWLFGGFVVYFVIYILFFIGLFVMRSLGSAM